MATDLRPLNSNISRLLHLTEMRRVPPLPPELERQDTHPRTLNPIYHQHRRLEFITSPHQRAPPPNPPLPLSRRHNRHKSTVLLPNILDIDLHLHPPADGRSDPHGRRSLVLYACRNSANDVGSRARVDESRSDAPAPDELLRFDAA